MKKNLKILIFFLSIILALLFFYGWKIVEDSYDKQDKIILFLKEIIPNKISRKIRDTIFIIPNLKTINKDLSLQVKKYEQGLQGQIFEKRKINFLDKELFISKYFLPFHRLDTRAGYESLNSTFRAHYLEIIESYILVMSGEGQSIFFEKKNIFKDKLSQKNIPNNLRDIVKQLNKKFYGIRDLLYFKNKIFVSVIVENDKGYSFDIYSADLNLEKLNFSLFFETKAYFKKWSVSSGGRLEKFKDNKILMSLGYSRVENSPQDMSTLLGKIFSINFDTKEYKIVSMGHRNPQGLIYLNERELVINTEHGPKGGDEINFNYLKEKRIPNFGYDIVSYGIEYDGTDPFKRPHKKYGFEEPFKYYPVSIAISEAVFLEKEDHFISKNILVVSSLRAGSLFAIELDDNLSTVKREQRISFGNERIRDLKYDKENNLLLLMFEMTPAIGVIKINN